MDKNKVSLFVSSRLRRLYKNADFLIFRQFMRIATDIIVPIYYCNYHYFCIIIIFKSTTQ